MTSAETRNLLTHLHDPSEDKIEDGLAADTLAAEDDFEIIQKRRDHWLIRLAGAFSMRRPPAATGLRRLILKISLLFGCLLLAIWIFWSSGMLPAWQSRLPVRYLCRSRAAYDPFSRII